MATIEATAVRSPHTATREKARLSTTREKAMCSKEDSVQLINKYIVFLKRDLEELLKKNKKPVSSPLEPDNPEA